MESQLHAGRTSKASDLHEGPGKQPGIALNEPTPASAHMAQGAELAHLKHGSHGNGSAHLGPNVFENGQSLDEQTRQLLEARFGADLGSIRIYNNPAAAQACQDMNAIAFTLQNHIAFAAGAYQPGTRQGMALLAHEVTHFLQSGGRTLASPGGTYQVGDAGGSHEAEANANAALSLARQNHICQPGCEHALVSQATHMCQPGCSCLGQWEHMAGYGPTPTMAEIAQAIPSEGNAESSAVFLGQEGVIRSSYSASTSADSLRVHRCGGGSKGGGSTKAKAPSITTVAANPTVRGAIATAWTASNPNGPGANKKEQGFWIIWNPQTGDYTFNHFPEGTRDGSSPTPRPGDSDTAQVVGFFHTHPNTDAEGYSQGPSPADIGFSNSQKLPHIIRSHNGIDAYEIRANTPS